MFSGRLSRSARISASRSTFSPRSRGNATAVQLREGLVVVRNALSLNEQVRLAETATDIGLAPPSHFLNDVPCNRYLLNDQGRTLMPFTPEDELPQGYPVPVD